jgi:hypothetical protein
MEKVFKYVFAGLGIVALISALFFGATHQLGTAALCGIMYLSCSLQNKEARQ